MAANAVVRARIDEHIKEQATAVLATMGLTVSDAFRLMLTRVALERALPFEPLVPNAVTVEAMKEARRGGLTSFASVDALMADPADPQDVAWRKHVCNAAASPDVDALTETAEAVTTLVAEHGPARLDLRGLKAASVQGEHLATLLRSSFPWRDQVPGWGEAMDVAKTALRRAGIDPAEALFGLV